MESKEYSGIIMFYISYINNDKIKLEDVPPVFREEVLRAMEASEGSEDTNV